MHNSTKFAFITLAAIMASMMFVPKPILSAQAQGGPMSGMNMSDRLP